MEGVNQGFLCCTQQTVNYAIALVANCHNKWPPCEELGPSCVLLHGVGTVDWASKLI